MAERAFGMQFHYRQASGSDSDYVALGEITDITPPSISRDLIETSSHASNVKTYLGGLVDFGEVSITVNYDPDGSDDEGLRNLASGTQHASGGDTAVPTNYLFKVTYASSTVETFNGIVTGFETSTPLDGQVCATITVKVSGSVTYS